MKRSRASVCMASDKGLLLVVLWYSMLWLNGEVEHVKISTREEHELHTQWVINGRGTYFFFN